MMDRIALVEVYAVLSWDYGLYTLWHRIQQFPFHPRLTLSYQTLDAEQKDYYHTLTERAEKTQAEDTRLWNEKRASLNGGTP